MKVEVDPASLSVGEFVALVNELRQQLAERDQEVERLRSLLLTESQATSPKENTVDSSAEPTPGSTEDLLAQLERIYPENK